MVGWMDGWMDGCGWMDVVGWMWMDGWMDGWMDRYAVTINRSDVKHVACWPCKTRQLILF
jgi:hypothetical protein